MKRKFYTLPLLMLSVATISLSACDDTSKQAEQTQETAVETPVVENAPVIVAPTMKATAATSFATAEGATTGAVFVTLKNTGVENDRLIGASTSITPVVEIHENVVDEATGVMQMRKVDGIEIIAGGQAELKADGNHIMLMNLSAPLVEGSSFDITLDFEKASDVVVPVRVVVAGLPATDAQDHSGHTMVPEEGGATDAQTPTDAIKSVVDETVTEEIAPVIEEVTPSSVTPQTIETPAVIDEKPAGQ